MSTLYELKVHRDLPHNTYLGYTIDYSLSRPKSGSVAGRSVGLIWRPPTLPSQPAARKPQTKLERQTVPCPCLPPFTIPPLLCNTTPYHPQRPSPCLLPAHTRSGSVCGRGGVCCHFWRWTRVGRAHAHPNQPWSPSTVTPLPFVDNECAIGLATSSVRPKKSKSIDMRLDWIKERVDQKFFCFSFLPGLINPTNFFTKILPVYRHSHRSLTLPSRHHLSSSPPHPFPHTHPHNLTTTVPVAAMQFATGTYLP